MKKIFSRFHGWFIDAWWLDLTAGIVVFAFYKLIPFFGKNLNFLFKSDLNNRLSVYTDLINISALIGGFLGLAFTTYLGWSSLGILRIKKTIGKRITKNWIIGICTPWVCAFSFLLSKIIESRNGVSSPVAMWVAIGSLIALTIGLFRSLSLFYLLATVNEHKFERTLSISDLQFSNDEEHDLAK